VYLQFLVDTDGISEEDVIEFIDAGKNVLIATDKNIGSFVSGIASECNVEFDEEESSVIDHLNFDTSNYDGQHDLIVAENIVDAPVVLGGKIEAPVLFRGMLEGRSC
jgi:oligosaccharyltransferase complex subunit beta